MPLKLVGNDSAERQSSEFHAPTEIALKKHAATTAPVGVLAKAKQTPTAAETPVLPASCVFLRKAHLSFSAFPYVCPEPVLANTKVLV